MDKFEYKIIAEYYYNIEAALNKYLKDGWKLSSGIFEESKYKLFLKRKCII